MPRVATVLLLCCFVSQLLSGQQMKWSVFHPGNAPISSSFIQQLIVDKEGQTWHFTNSYDQLPKLSRFDGTTWNTAQLKTSASTLPIKTLLWQDSHIGFLFTETQLFPFEYQNDTIHLSSPIALPSYFQHLQMLKGKLIIHGIEGSFQLANEKWQALSFPLNTVSSCKTPAGFFAAGSSGLFFLDSLSANPKLVQEGYIQKVLWDSTRQVLWVLDRGSGLYQYKNSQLVGHWNEPDRFTNYNNLYNDMVLDSSGNIWIACNTYLFRFNGENWQHFSSSNSPLPSDQINVLALGESGVLWLGTARGLAVLNVK